MKKRFLWLVAGMILFFHASLSWGKEGFVFDGQLNWKKKEADITVTTQAANAIQLKIKEVSKARYSFQAVLEHFRLNTFNLSSEIEGSLRLDPENSSRQDVWIGEVSSRYSLLDYKPIREMTGSFKIEENKFKILFFDFGRIQAKGRISLTSPYKINADVHLDTVNLDDFISFWVKRKKYDVTGNVYGDIKISGALEKPYLKGRFKSGDGLIKSLAFNEIDLNIEGYYPEMNISDSILTEAGGLSFTFSGPFDLSDKDNFKKQIKALTKAPLVRELDSDVEWTIRKREEDSVTTEFKYFLKKKTDIGTDENSAVLGIERKMRF